MRAMLMILGIGITLSAAGMWYQSRKKLHQSEPEAFFFVALGIAVIAYSLFGTSFL